MDTIDGEEGEEFFLIYHREEEIFLPHHGS